MKKGFFATLFPKAADVVASLMGIDDMNALETEAQEVQNRLDAQAQGNAQVVADYSAFTERLTAIETANGQLTARLETLATENTQLTTWRTNAEAATKQTAAADATTVDTTLPKLTASQEHLDKMISAGTL